MAHRAHTRTIRARHGSTHARSRYPRLDPRAHEHTRARTYAQWSIGRTHALTITPYARLSIPRSGHRIHARRPPAPMARLSIASHPHSRYRRHHGHAIIPTRRHNLCHQAGIRHVRSIGRSSHLRDSQERELRISQVLYQSCETLTHNRSETRMRIRKYENENLPAANSRVLLGPRTDSRFRSASARQLGTKNCGPGQEARQSECKSERKVRNSPGRINSEKQE